MSSTKELWHEYLLKRQDVKRIEGNHPEFPIKAVKLETAYESQKEKQKLKYHRNKEIPKDDNVGIGRQRKFYKKKTIEDDNEPDMSDMFKPKSSEPDLSLFQFSLF